MLKLIPMPKQIIEKNDILLKSGVFYHIEDIDYRLKKVVTKLPYSDDGIKLKIEVAGNDGDGYYLDISNDSIKLSAESVRGAFYGVQTLRQIFENQEIPCCIIKDSPDFAERGFYHDVTRGKVPTLESLKELVDEMAYLKMNSLQLYIEHTFEFEEYADVNKRTGYLTAEEIIELDKYCLENFIELIPSLACFGHLYELLEQKRYNHLKALDDYKQKHFFFCERMWHHTIDPINPESIEIIKSLIDQFVPLFSSDKFNICCDETFDLKNGKHNGKDIGNIYVTFINMIIKHLKAKGKKVMMWGDILHEHHEKIKEIPNDVMLLNWYYDADECVAEDMIRRFHEAGREQIVCPGTTTWNKLCEVIDTSLPNIENMSKYGWKYGARGILNTNWGDYGNLCSLELAMCGLSFGAEKAWNVDTTIAEFLNCFDYLIYQKENGIEIVKELGEIQDKIRWFDFVHHYSNTLFGKTLDVKLPDEDTILEARDSCEIILEKLKNECWGNDKYRKNLIIAVEGTEVIAELMAKAQGMEIKRYTNTKEWLEKYHNLWLTKNKESEFCEIEKIFLSIDN